MNQAAKRVAVITGARSDYGLLRPILLALQRDPRFSLQLLVAATHLQPAYGLTATEVEADGLPIAARIASADIKEAADLGMSIADEVRAFTETFGRLQPQMLLVLGDRHEALSAALAAAALGIPIAHLHGGELSEGSIDDAQRHCLTKLAHIHFVATRLYGERVCQLGEEPDRVFVVGAPAVDAIRSLPLLGREELSEALGGISLERPLVALTLHPESLDADAAEREAAEVVAGVDAAIGRRSTVIITLPNDDLGNIQTRRVLLEYSELHENVHAFAALGQLRYLSLLRHADIVVGNSSSGLIETPSFELPTVNIGRRQHGRLRADNVIDIDSDAHAVASAVKRALDPAFRASLSGMPNPFGDGNTAARVIDVLDTTDLGIRHKRFFDLPDGQWRANLVFGSDLR